MNQPGLLTRFTCALLVATGALSSGCVFDDIHEELVTINNNMEETQDLLRHANGTLDDVQTQLNQVQRTNELLVQLQAGLGTEELATTEAEERLSVIGTMENIDDSLAKMDEHLASLRKTISNIDSTIPFLSLGGDADDAEVEEAVASEGAAAAKPAAAAAGVAPE